MRQLKAINVYKLFDPIYLKDLLIISLQCLVDKLGYFRYSIFTSEFLTGLKNKIPIAKVEASNGVIKEMDEYNSTAQYVICLDTWRKRCKLNRDYHFD